MFFFSLKYSLNLKAIMVYNNILIKVTLMYIVDKLENDELH